jgi:hypothetical protein
MQRFVWDLHYPAPKALRYEYPISAIYMDTPRHPLGPAVLPGQYAVRLTVAGQTLTRTLNVEIDPRVRTPRAGLDEQFKHSAQAADGMTQSFDALEQIKKLRTQIKELRARPSLPPALAEALAAIDVKAAAIEGGGPTPPVGAVAKPGLAQTHSSLATLLDVLQQADAAPTTQAVAASSELQQRLRELMSAWSEFRRKDVETINGQLRAAGLSSLGA